MRDRRGENAFGAESRETHERLLAWADWQRETHTGSGGMSTIARMMEYGVSGAGSADAPVSLPEHIEAVDRAVQALPAREKHVIVGYYCEQKPWEAMAHELYTTTDAVKNAMRAARHRVGAFVHGWMMARGD